MEQSEEKETLRQRVVNFFQRSAERIRVTRLKKLTLEEKEKHYIQKIEKAIESFRFMSKEEQREEFQDTFSSMRDDFITGGIDNKKCVKHAAHFLKITHTLFSGGENTFDEAWDEGITGISDAQEEMDIAFYRFKSELLGIEKIKETNFLDFLDHEESIKIKDSIFRTIGIISDSIEYFNTLESLGMHDLSAFSSTEETDSYKDDIEDFEKTVKSYRQNIDNESEEIQKIIVKNLQEITNKKKIDKLKQSSEIFRSKAGQYKTIAGRLMLGAIAIVGMVIFFACNDFLKNENYFEKFSFVENNKAETDKAETDKSETSKDETNKTEINKNVFYAYVILDILLSGRLLLSLIALTGFFYCLRFYAANNHNAIICDQRANTLESFEALYENAEKPEEKLRVVEKVLNSATEHLPTGFSKQQSDSSGGSGSRVGGIDLSKFLSFFGRSSAD